MFLNRVSDANPCLIMINLDPSAPKQLYFVDGDVPEWRKKGASPYPFELKPPEALVEGSLHWAPPSLSYPSIISFVVEGSLHWAPPGLSYPSIISFELAEEVFQQIPLPCIGFYFTSYHLCVLNGCLSIAGSIHDGQLEIWVMKEYNVKESWVKEFCITTNYGSTNFVPLFCFDGQNNAPLGMLIEDLALSWVGRCIRVLCVLKNGEIVLECNKKAVVSYDPKTNRFRALRINRLPQQFQAFVFQPTLFSAKETIEMKL